MRALYYGHHALTFEAGEISKEFQNKINSVIEEAVRSGVDTIHLRHLLCNDVHCAIYRSIQKVTYEDKTNDNI